MNINRAQILLDQGHRDEAMRCLARAEDLFMQIGWRDSAAKAAIAQATAAVETGDLDGGERRAMAALAELEHSPSKLDKARVLNLLARIERLRKKPHDALAHLNDVERLLGKQGSLDQAWRLRETGLCHMDLKDAKKAETLLRQAMAMYRKAKSPAQVATTAAYLGDVLRLLGKHDEAFKVYREALAEVEDLAV
jgi:tetratricopeptide (TPR) repeat protein